MILRTTMEQNRIAELWARGVREDQIAASLGLKPEEVSLELDRQAEATLEAQAVEHERLARERAGSSNAEIYANLAHHSRRRADHAAVSVARQANGHVAVRTRAGQGLGRRESRGAPVRTRGSRRGSKSSAGGGDPGDGSDLDQPDSEPLMLGLWRHPRWGPCSPGLLRVLLEHRRNRT